MAFERQARAVVDFAGSIYRVTITSRKYSWAGLKLWLKAYYDSEAENMVHTDGDSLSAPYYMAVKAFEMVALLREDSEWDKVEKVLDKYQEATIGVMKWK